MSMHPKGPLPRTQPPQAQINKKAKETIVCEKCGNQTFSMAFLFKKISAVLSPNGKESMIPLQVYKCDECGHINKEFLPKG